MPTAAIIGAGPAGLCAAIALSSNEEINLIIIERGGHYTQRNHNQGGDISAGVGGLGLYSDGKFSFGPSGSGLYALFDQDLVRSAYDAVCNQLTTVGIETAEYPSELVEGVLSNGAGVYHKQYPSFSSDLATRRKLIARLCELVERKNVQWRLHTRVTGVCKIESGYQLELESCKDRQAPLVVDGVVYATGRFSVMSLSLKSESLGILYHDVRCEIGLRIDFPASIGPLNRHDELDVKLIWPPQEDQPQVRTFCTCRQGQVWQIQYGGFSALSGRSDCDPTSYSNFGLLLRFEGEQIKLGLQYLDMIRQIDAIKSGRALWQPLQDFIANQERIAEDAFEQQKGRAWHPQELFTPALLAQLLPEGLYRLFFNALNKLLAYAGDLDHRDTMVLFPVIEGVGAYPKVDKAFQVAPDFVVAGDSCGLFRGTVPSMVSGHAAGVSLVRSLSAKPKRLIFKSRQ